MNTIPFDARAKIYEDALRTFGISNQLVVALEELSEVQKEICKVLRGEFDPEALAEEVADATIMLEQIRQMFAINGMVCSVMDDKMLRLRRRIEEARGQADGIKNEGN